MHFNLGLVNFLALFTVSKIILAPFSIAMLVLMIVTLYNYITKKVSFRHRKVLELAARPVENITDGFTARPYPIGAVKSSKKEIIDFARYLTKNFIAMSYFEEEKVYSQQIVTEVTQFGKFYIAEDYHINYYARNKNQGYCQFVIAPKLDKFRKIFKDDLKK